MPSPPCFLGEGNTRWRERGWESPNSDEGHTLWYSLYVRTLCLWPSVTSLLSVLVLCNLSTTSLLYACLSGICILVYPYHKPKSAACRILVHLPVIRLPSDYLLSFRLFSKPTFACQFLLYVCCLSTCLHHPIPFFFPFHLFLSPLLAFKLRQR